MTTLLIQTENTPLTVNFPAIARMTHAQFDEFCQANRDLRIESTTTGEVIVMPPAFSDTGNLNLNIAGQLWNWTDKGDTHGEVRHTSN
jgi:Uma2 family endonuclease